MIENWTNPLVKIKCATIKKIEKKSLVKLKRAVRNKFIYNTIIKYHAWDTGADIAI